jgi:hypothetical protein
MRLRPPNYKMPTLTTFLPSLPDSLVYMQMFHTLAHLLRPGAPEIVLYETDTTDVIAVHGLLFPMPRLDSKGVRVIIR